jgi:hypothetical protein
MRLPFALSLGHVIHPATCDTGDRADRQKFTARLFDGRPIVLNAAHKPGSITNGLKKAPRLLAAWYVGFQDPSHASVPVLASVGH